VPQKRKNLAIAYLDDIGKPLKARGLKVSSAVAGGYAAERIINYAESNSIDLIAMSTHGRTGMGRWVFGSVTDKLLHAGNKPLLVIHPK
jgi:nucleotide-binding universal stress UspA family protein